MKYTNVENITQKHKNNMTIDNKNTQYKIGTKIVYI